jgi:endonuclease YncB( thermonuclease family)
MRRPRTQLARALATMLGLIFVIGSLGTVRAIDQRSAEPSGAPEPKTGPFRPTGFVRVIDGSTLEATVDGKRIGVGVLGIDAPSYGTGCGDAARAQLQSLVGRGAVFQDDRVNVLDARKRRLYQVSTPDGGSAGSS